MARLGQERATAEAYAEAIRNAYRDKRFAAGTRMVRIVEVAPTTGGPVEGGLWAEEVPITYETYTTA